MIKNRQIFSPRQGGLVAIKISNFSPFLNDTILETMGESESYPQRKHLMHTSYTHRQPQEHQLRTIHTSFQARQLQQSQLHTIEPSKRYKQDLLPKVNHNMRQLKDIMKQKVATLKQMQRTNQNAFNFTQYKIKDIHTEKWNLSSLHSRNTNQSTLYKSLKSKKTSSHSQSKNSPQRRKQKSTKKMVLVGGSIPVRAVANPEPLPLSYFYRHVKKAKGGGSGVVKGKAGVVGEYENDCKPWQIQQSSNIYHLYER